MKDDTAMGDYESYANKKIIEIEKDIAIVEKVCSINGGTPSPQRALLNRLREDLVGWQVVLRTCKSFKL